MGYDIHITRAPNWFDNAGYEISLQEWLELVSSDPELSLDTENGSYCATWSGQCSYPWGGWFDWFEGNIYTKNPDRCIIAKMLQLAVSLNAKVQGDGGEVYSTTEDRQQY
jgi:hypothetical protein